jgi:SNF2 family DNA or RNA helicase
MARVHGPLQKKNVLYKDIVMNNSIDEKIIALIKKKIELVKEFQSLAENAEKHKEKSFDEMSIEEVLNLL